MDSKTSEQLREELASEVRSAFKNTGKPRNRKNIGAHGIGDAFGGTHWRNLLLTPDVVQYYAQEMHDLAGEWFCYYLPTFLVAMLLHDRGPNIRDVLTNALIPPVDDFQQKGFQAQVKCLTQRQRAVIYKLFANYTRLFSDNLWPQPGTSDDDEHLRALEFWHQ